MKSNRIAHVIAGTIEMFVGAYFVTFGALAAIYFYEMHRPHRAMAAIAGALFGALLVFRAERMLGWKLVLSSDDRAAAHRADHLVHPAAHRAPLTP